MNSEKIAVDLEFCQNNRTLAIRPGQGGRLSHLVRFINNSDELKDNSQRSWIFKDPDVYTDSDGNERIDHITRGVTCGFLKQGYEFLQICKDVGLFAREKDFFVPFSNVQKSSGIFAYLHPDRKEEVKPEFSQTDLVLMRWDLPTGNQLVAAASHKAKTE